MRVYSIILKNIVIRPWKTLVLIVAPAVAIAVCVSLFYISGAMSVDLQDTIDEYGANIVITPDNESTLSYGGVTAKSGEAADALLPLADVEKIRSIKNRANINVVAPKVISVVPVDGARQLLVGVRFTEEFELKKWWDFQAGRAPSRSDELLLGGKAARDLGVKPGDMLQIAGQRFEVAGVLKRAAMQEDEFVMVDLERAQKLLGIAGRVNMVEVSAWCKDCPIDDMVSQIKGVMPGAKVAAVRQVAETRELVIGQFDLFSMILTAALTLIALLIIFTNIVGMVSERRREIGILRALGYRRSHILVIILGHVFIAGLLSGVAGFAVGFFGSHAIAARVLALDVEVAFEPFIALSTIGLALLLAVTAGIYPSVRAALINPAEAVREL